MSIQVAYYSDIGNTRDVNQDALVVRSADTNQGQLVMSAVCDGMGGLSRGELASSTAVRELSEWFERDLLVLLQDGYEFFSLREGIELIIRRISMQLESYSRINGVSLGTTLAMIILYNGSCVIANVGDSRIYAVGENIDQLTRDHSVVQRELDRGVLTAEDAKSDNRRNILYQCLGESTGLTPDIIEYSAASDTAYLLCTDGFWHLFDPREALDEIRSCMRRDSDAMKDTLTTLSRRAMEQGETDNITAVMVGMT